MIKRRIEPVEMTEIRKLLRWAIITELIWWGIIAFLAFVLRPVFGWDQLELLHPFWLFGSLLVVLIALVFIKRSVWKLNLARNYSGGKTAMLQVTFNWKLQFLYYFLLRTCVTCLFLTLAQPVIGKAKVNDERSTLDLVVCLDISASMNTQDIAPKTSRLLIAKRALNQLLSELKGERIAIVVFANSAYTELPLTADYGAAKLFLNEIKTDMISAQGTNIGAALALAKKQFVDAHSKPAILVITDGEDHEQAWKNEAKELAKQNVPICFLGVGTTKGGPVPKDVNQPKLGFKRLNGNPVISRLEEVGLKAMAQSTNSSLYFARTAFPDMQFLARDISSEKHVSKGKRQIEVAQNYYRIPLILSVLCLMAMLLVPSVLRSKSRL